ncbi:MAG: Uma2 family endonuclease [Chloroherpetonaceae bacterium]|nr:Uma2 family endonuclease [Chloroherpetonaceae bacterium]
MSIVERIKPRARSKAWVERQRKRYDAMRSDAGGFDFIEFLNGDIIVRALPENAQLPSDADIILDMPTSIRHQRIQARLLYALMRFVSEHRLGEVFGAPTDLRLGGNVVQPDIVFVATEHLNRVKELEIVGYADLVVEILSKTSVKRDRQTKFRLYQDAKIPSYWLVSPDAKQVELYRLAKDGYDMTAVYSSDETLQHDFGNGKILELKLNAIFQ